MAYEYQYLIEDMPDAWPFEDRIEEVKRLAHIHPARLVRHDNATGLYYFMIDEATEKHHLDAALEAEREKWTT